MTELKRPRLKSDFANCCFLAPTTNGPVGGVGALERLQLLVKRNAGRIAKELAQTLDLNRTTESHQLPQELCTMIVEQLCHRDLVRLSSTCRSCRVHFAPLVFHTIRFGNNKRTANSALVAAKTHNYHVRRLEFSYIAKPEKVNGDEVPPLLKSHALLPASRQLLEGCPTPKADVVSLCFKYTDFRKMRGGYNDSNDIFDLLHDIEHPIATMNAEQRYRWRAVLNETYRAIAKNLIVRKLELVAWSPHLSNYQHSQPWDYTLGGKDPNAVEMPLRPGDLPLLQSLEVSDILICPELAEFIVDHAKTLSSLALVECISGTDAPVGEGHLKRTETWAFFFLKLNEFEPPALVNLSIILEDIPIVDLYNLEDVLGSNVQRSESIEETRVKIEQIQEKDPNRTIFLYMGSDWPIITNPDGSIKGAQAIDDYYEYQRLMKFVKKNAQRIARKENQICAV
ncbi:hypothetical protein G3M48_006473 [Beauveria asiatica]|uniref:F-box domain-containing protein n=1 Tax=Beauveria asiatica TaxID=1069075 RepID=A0AAW0RPM6_9HYPO